MTTAARLVRIPIIAAGGIGDPQSFLAVLAMGAKVAYIAAAFMATKECPISGAFKSKLVEVTPNNAKLCERILGRINLAKWRKVLAEKDKLPSRE